MRDIKLRYHSGHVLPYYFSREGTKLVLEERPEGFPEFKMLARNPSALADG